MGDENPNPTGKEIDNVLKNLPRDGEVKRHIDGGIYLELDHDWINNTVKVASDYGYEIPPFFDYEGCEGAHVKIAMPSEMEIGEKDVEKLIGKKVKFEAFQAYISSPEPETYGLEKIIKIKVESTKLNQIRKILTGKKSPPNGKFFYIILAVREINPKKTLGMKSDYEEELEEALKLDEKWWTTGWKDVYEEKKKSKDKKGRIYMKNLIKASIAINSLAIILVISLMNSQ